MPSRIPDAVVLVPGFLGFNRIGGFYYFAERVMSVLRGAIELHLGRPVPVVPCATLPMGRLADRQQFLLEWLDRLDLLLGGVERFHLVGHSAGGVDAHFLTCSRPLFGSSWGELVRVREKVASVAAIASPFHGTHLASSDIARFVRSPRQNPAVLPAVARMAGSLARLALRVTAADDLVAGLLSGAPGTLTCLMHLWKHRELIDDLHPERILELRKSHVPERRVPLRSFVTVTLTTDEVQSEAEPFFLELRRLTAAHGGADSKAHVQRAIALLSKQASSSVRAPNAAIPMIDGASNDGVVNSVYQVLDAEAPSELGGIFVADHADVLGHYDHKDALAGGPPLNAGLFHSASFFGDDQFFELYRRVATSVVDVIESTGVPARVARGVALEQRG